MRGTIGHRCIPLQRPVTRSSDLFFDLRLNKRLCKQSRHWWFEYGWPTGYPYYLSHTVGLHPTDIYHIYIYDMCIVISYGGLSKSPIGDNNTAYPCHTDELLSHPYVKGKVLSCHMDELLGPPYEITTRLTSCGWVNKSSACDCNRVYVARMS